MGANCIGEKVLIDAWQQVPAVLRNIAATALYMLWFLLMQSMETTIHSDGTIQEDIGMQKPAAWIQLYHHYTYCHSLSFTFLQG